MLLREKNVTRDGSAEIDWSQGMMIQKSRGEQALGGEKWGSPLTFCRERS